MAVVENDQPAGVDELPQEVEIDEDVAERVAAVHEAGIGYEVLGDKGWQR